MSPFWLDVEVLADREADLQALTAQLAEEDETAQDGPQKDNDLPPVIQDEVPHVGSRKRRRKDPVSSADKPERPSESILRSIRRIADSDKED